MPNMNPFLPATFSGKASNEESTYLHRNICIVISGLCYGCTRAGIVGLQPPHPHPIHPTLHCRFLCFLVLTHSKGQPTIPNQPK